MKRPCSLNGILMPSPLDSTNRLGERRGIIDMDKLWMGIATAQSAATPAKSRGHGILSILAGVGITLLVGLGLCMLAVLNS
jgi:hypothetical protein